MSLDVKLTDLVSNAPSLDLLPVEDREIVTNTRLLTQVKQGEWTFTSGVVAGFLLANMAEMRVLKKRHTISKTLTEPKQKLCLRLITDLVTMYKWTRRDFDFLFKEMNVSWEDLEI